MKKKPNYKSNAPYIIIAFLMIVALYVFTNTPGTPQEVRQVGITEIYSSENISKVEVKNNTVTAYTNNGEVLQATKEPTDVVSEHFKEAGIPVTIVDTEQTTLWRDILIGIIPFILIVGFLFFMMRQAQSSNNTALSFGKSRARLYEGNKQSITFKDVAGVKEAKEELVEIVDFLKHPAKYKQIGAKIPRGVMLIGPPGTGKTLLAKAVAGEAKVPFFNISGSEFVEMFVGVGASRVRDLFNKAKRNAPCIIFMDEIDAVGRHRGAGLGGGHDEREQTLNQILVEMDGFDTGTNVIVIAATNRPDVLDPALLRPGRFDRRVIIDLPDLNDRKDILKVHSKNKPIQKSVDLGRIARQTPGFSGADLENLMNEGAILAARENRKTIAHKDLENAIEKVVLGPERKSRVISKKEREIVAYHEAGHAIAGHYLEHCDPVHKISIISRGMAGGVTWFLPKEDSTLLIKSKIEDDLASLLGGYVAEELMFGEVSSGASSDLKRATEMSRNMVTKWGMSKDIGPVAFNNSDHNVFLGKELTESKNYSEDTARLIDEELSAVIKNAYKRTMELLTKHKEKLEETAQALLKHETLTEKEFLAIVNS